MVERFPQRTTIRVAGPARVVNRLFDVQLVDRVDPVVAHPVPRTAR